MEWFDTGDDTLPKHALLHLQKARGYITDPPSQSLYRLSMAFIRDFHKAFRIMYMTAMLMIDVEKLDECHVYADRAAENYPDLPYKLPHHDQNDCSLPYKDHLSVMEDMHRSKMVLIMKDDMEMFRQVMPYLYNEHKSHGFPFKKLQKTLKLPAKYKPIPPMSMQSVTYPPFASPESPHATGLTDVSTPETDDVMDDVIDKKLPAKRTTRKRKGISEDKVVDVAVIKTKSSKGVNEAKVVNSVARKKKPSSVNEQLDASKRRKKLKSSCSKNDDNVSYNESIPSLRDDTTIVANDGDLSSVARAFSSRPAVLKVENPKQFSLKSPPVANLDPVIASFPPFPKAYERLGRVELGCTWNPWGFKSDICSAENDGRLKTLRAYLRGLGKYQKQDDINEWKPNKIQKKMHETVGQLGVWRPLELSSFPTDLTDMYQQACFGHIPPALNLSIVMLNIGLFQNLLFQPFASRNRLLFLLWSRYKNVTAPTFCTWIVHKRIMANATSIPKAVVDVLTLDQPVELTVMNVCFWRERFGKSLFGRLTTRVKWHAKLVSLVCCGTIFR